MLTPILRLCSIEIGVGMLWDHKHNICTQNMHDKCVRCWYVRVYVRVYVHVYVRVNVRVYVTV